MENMTYEEAVKKLEEIVSQLENGDLTLEESIKLYEESSLLSAYCSDLLNKAEAKIKEFSQKDKEE
ncbi:MAG: exodeoxyribonuclease VII small subunit [Ruminococcaceae bacterium]|jgi:exodeoxyribonuclease VII small subunit|nr:exodeoxyribonuclease VII small subunit [Oscillospiraceae bacterium]